LIWFSIFSFLTIIIVIIFNGAYFNRKARISDVINTLYELHSEVLMNIMIVDNFIGKETINPDYYLNGESEYLTRHRNNINSLNKDLEELFKDPVSIKLEIADDIDKLRMQIENYEFLLTQLDELIQERGFKDYGLVGEMRNYVHKLETYPELDRANVLSLRRHEKDYIIRNDQQYVDKLNRLGTKMKNQVASSSSLSGVKKDSLIILLDNYVKTFNRIVDLDRRIGVRSGAGLKADIDDFENKIYQGFEDMVFAANSSKDRIFMELEVYYVLYFILLIVFSVILSLYISRRVTHPLSTLTAYIQALVKSDLKTATKLSVKHSHNEIQILYKEFLHLIQKIEKRESERDTAEKALKENELKYRQLTDMLPQSVFETNEVGNLTYVNKNLLETFGYNKNDLAEGINLIEVIISDNKNLVIEGKEFNTNEFQALRKDGSTFPALVYSNAIIQDNKIKGYRGIIIDHTERKKYVDALQKEKRKAEKSDRLKSAFLANMSHEIRTPMNAIIGFTGLIARNNLAAKERHEYIRHIQNSGEVLLNLIDDIIDIAKIEAGELKIIEKEYDINEMMNDLHRTFQQSLRQNRKEHIQLIMERFVDSGKFHIKTDPFRLKQIMTNLLSNATKFTEKGQVNFGYRLEKDDMITFFVHDTGIGMTEENKKIVFDRFRQVEDSLNRKYGGTGLGLAISRHIITLMKGKIWLESEKGKGTKFYVSLPYKPAEKQAIHIRSQENEKELIDWSDKMILIAEDDDNNYFFLKSALKPTRLNLKRAINGKDAVEIIKNDKEKNFQLVLMDIQMPVMNGYESTAQIKRIRKDLPVIAQTAYAMSGEKEKSKKAGCDDL